MNFRFHGSSQGPFSRAWEVFRSARVGFWPKPSRLSLASTLKPIQLNRATECKPFLADSKGTLFQAPREVPFDSVRGFDIWAIKRSWQGFSTFLAHIQKHNGVVSPIIFLRSQVVLCPISKSMAPTTVQKKHTSRIFWGCPCSAKEPWALVS